MSSQLRHPTPAIQAYLHEVLGAATNLRPWADARRLPFFLTDSFEFAEVVLFGQPAVLAIDRGQSALTPSDIAARIKAVRTAAPRVAYVADRLAFRERRALIGLRVPFIVPGNQLYLPDLGIDLREYLPRGGAAHEAAPLKPAAQALLVASLLAKPWQRELHPATLARALGYTAMTASRAANELVAAGLVESGTLAQPGGPRYLQFKAASPRAVWESAEPLMNSPVLRTVWLDKLPKGLKVRVAGEEALARHSLLEAPAHRVRAARREDWLAAMAADPLLQDLGRDAARIELQIWRYSPALARGQAVDLLSLLASLRDAPDERVQIATKELRDAMPW